MNETVTPVWVILDGENKPFKSYMACEEVNYISSIGGLNYATQMMLKEVPERPIPQHFKDGISMCKDVWVCIVPGPAFQG